MASIGSMRGYKDTFGPMKIMAISYWGVGLPLGIILSITDIVTTQMGAVGMWTGMASGLLNCRRINGKKGTKKYLQNLLMKIEVNAMGLVCPEPIMLLHKAIRDSDSGDLIELVASDKSTERDVEKFCEFHGSQTCRKKLERIIFILLFKRKIRYNLERRVK